MAFGTSRLITPASERRLTDVRHLLAELRDTLTTLPAVAAALQTLDASIRQLDELFMIVVVGEFNAGKSAFVNALLGDRVFEEGVTPTTAGIQLVRHGATATRDDAAGPLVFGIESVSPPHDPDQRLVVYTVEPDSATARVLPLLAGWGADDTASGDLHR